MITEAPMILRRQKDKERSDSRALLASEVRYRDLLDSVSDIIWSCDLNGNLLSLNKAGCRTLGYRANQINGQRISLIVADDFLDSVMCDEVKSVEGRVALAPRRIDLLTSQGEPVGVEVRPRLVYEGGRHTGFQYIARDLTDQKLIEKKTQRIEKEWLEKQRLETIGRFASGIAHDFNNLLQAINGNSELLLRSCAPGDKVRNEVEPILDAGKRAAALTRQLLEFIRGRERGLNPIDLNQLLEGLVKMLRRIIGEDIDIVVESSATLPHVIADCAEMEQVIMNLAINARDAMPRGGMLVLKTDQVRLDESWCRQHLCGRPGSYARMSVSDTGEGMDSETLSHIFEPFFTTKAEGKGTGLGLAVLHRIVREHEGFTNVASDRGRGTTFEIYLPAYEGAIASQEVVTSQPGPRGGNETILLAEDEETLRRLAQTVLALYGYEVLVAANGQEALRVYEGNRGKVDLLVLDKVMPKMGGEEVMAHLRSAGYLIPAIIVTGYGPDSVTATQAVSVIQKPYSVTDFVRSVREVLDRTLTREAGRE